MLILDSLHAIQRYSNLYASKHVVSAIMSFNSLKPQNYFIWFNTVCTVLYTNAISQYEI